MQTEARLVRLILECHGFHQTESNDWNVLWTCSGTSSKAHIYESLNESQKINHFVNSTELTRKDRFCFNLVKMQQKFGRSNFDFIPETFILPDEYNEFHKTFSQY
jgi:tubulin polyglutamylase TTLL5